MSALETQVAGSHYKDLAIQPVEYIHANGLPFIEGSIVKYATRWQEKGGVDDLRKIIHFAQILIELETQKLLKEAARHTRQAVADYCDSEQYDTHGDLSHDDSWRATDFGPCEHQHWHKFLSTKTQRCADCGIEQPLSNNAKQVEHKRKSGC